MPGPEVYGRGWGPESGFPHRPHPCVLTACRTSCPFILLLPRSVCQETSFPAQNTLCTGPSRRMLVRLLSPIIGPGRGPCSNHRVELDSKEELKEGEVPDKATVEVKCGQERLGGSMGWRWELGEREQTGEDKGGGGGQGGPGKAAPPSAPHPHWPRGCRCSRQGSRWPPRWGSQWSDWG